MIAALDSSTPPSAAQVAQAKAAGVRLWAGYIQTRTGVKLYHPWVRAEFDVARGCGSTPIAYASGWDDPVAVKALAAAWNVRLCLDVEGGIRGLGPWTQPWLDASGAGLYGNLATHAACHAPFRILYGYYLNPDGSTPDPRATWRGPAPAEPHGYQWFNTHTEFGVGVDRNWMDDWFAQGGLDDMTPEQDARLIAVENYLKAIFNLSSGQLSAVLNETNQQVKDLHPAVADVKAAVVAIPEGPPGPPGPATVAGIITGSFTAKP